MRKREIDDVDGFCLFVVDGFVSFSLSLRTLTSIDLIFNSFPQQATKEVLTASFRHLQEKQNGSDEEGCEFGIDLIDLSCRSKRSKERLFEILAWRL